MHTLFQAYHCGSSLKFQDILNSLPTNQMQTNDGRLNGNLHCLQHCRHINVAAPYLFNPQILTHQQRAFENIVGKGEIACNKQFLFFPQCFQLYKITVSLFVIISLFAIELEKPKIVISGKGILIQMYLGFHKQLL